MSNKQSSVEWVIENLTLIHALLSRREIGVEFFNRKYNEIVEQGKAMHEEEIINFHIGVMKIGLIEEGERIWTDAYLPKIKEMATEYYNKTFGGNNES